MTDIQQTTKFDPSELMSAQEIADHFSKDGRKAFSQDWYYRRMRDGDIEHVHMNGHWYTTPQWVYEYCEAGHQQVERAKRKLESPTRQKSMEELRRMGMKVKG